MELFNLINFYECLEEGIVEKLGFLAVENYNKKAPWVYWFILMTNPSQTKP